MGTKFGKKTFFNRNCCGSTVCDNDILKQNLQSVLYQNWMCLNMINLKETTMVYWMIIVSVKTTMIVVFFEMVVSKINRLDWNHNVAMQDQ